MSEVKTAQQLRSAGANHLAAGLLLRRCPSEPTIIGAATVEGAAGLFVAQLKYPIVRRAVHGRRFSITDPEGQIPSRRRR
jgi:hypothetical protein